MAKVSQAGVTVASKLDSAGARISQAGVTVAGELDSAGARISQAGVTVAAYPVPDPPSNLVATATGSSTITVTWTNNVMDRDGLQLERGTDGINFPTVISLGPDVESYDDSGLDPNTTYYYRIAATLSGVVGPYSAVVNATTMTESGGMINLLAALLLWLDEFD